MLLLIDKFYRLSQECRRVNIITNKNVINQNAIRYNMWKKLLSNEYYNDYLYYFNIVFNSNRKRFNYHLIFLKSIDPPDIKCKYCGKSVNRWVSYGYSDFCDSSDCIKSSYIERVNNSKETCLSKYGVDNTSKLKEVQDKRKQTCIDRFGVDHPLKSSIVKEKIKQTLIEKYGVEYLMQNKEIKEKVKQIMIDKYGGYTTQSEELNKKVKQTLLDKYGVDHPLKSEKIRIKLENTNLSRYGVKYIIKSPIIQDKIKQTNLSKYGVEYPLKSEIIRSKCNQTCIDHFGVDNPIKSPIIQDKIKQTNLSKYGTEYPQYRHYYYNNIYFDSSYELVFYKFCIDHNINIEREPSNPAIYYYTSKNNKKHRYYPDFKISYLDKTRLVEISSNYTWSTKSDEKKKVMKDNNILIILEDNIQKYFYYCKKINFNLDEYKI